jgi:MbtH protein
MKPNESEHVRAGGLSAVWLVLVNEDGLFSICEAGGAIPAGWSVLGPSGTKEECLGFIDDNLTDMRPYRPRT